MKMMEKANVNGPIMAAGRNERGMTLIELLAVLLILGILAAVAVPLFMNVIQQSRTDAFVSNGYAFKEATNYYLKDKVMRGEELTKITYKELVEAGFLETVSDPDTGDDWNPADNASYVTAIGTRVVGVCLYGEKRRLCGMPGKDGPVPFTELTSDLVMDNP